VDDRQVPWSIAEETGLIAVDLPPGEATIGVRWQPLLAERLGRGVFLGSVLILVGIALYRRRARA
jgi:hypothetical protein